MSDDEIDERLLKFGPLSISAWTLYAEFTPERELIQRLATEQNINVDTATTTYKAMCEAAAVTGAMTAITQAEAHARKLFAAARVALTEERARQMLLACAERGAVESQQKDVLLAAAAFVTAQELRRGLAVNSDGLPTLPPSWSTVHLVHMLAMWGAASGLHREFEITRSTARATEVRQQDQVRRVQKLADAVADGSVADRVAAVLSWRQHKATAANKRRAQRDLKAARKLLARKTPS